jgi:hypothetical protein
MFQRLAKDVATDRRGLTELGYLVRVRAAVARHRSSIITGNDDQRRGRKKSAYQLSAMVVHLDDHDPKLKIRTACRFESMN